MSDSGFQTWSQTSGTNATADVAINWQEGMAPSQVNDSARAMMSVLAKWRDDNNGSLTTTGGTTAYALTTNSGFTALAAGLMVAFTLNATNTGTTTINVNSLGAKPLRPLAGTEFGSGALVAGAVYHAAYFTTNSGEWIVFDQAALGDGTVTAAKLASNAVTTAKITDANVTLAKIVNTAASRLLGNPTGSAAAPSEISLSTGLAFSGTSLVASTNGSELAGYLSGLELSTAGSSSTFSVAAGAANDVSYGGLMARASSISKTTASWAVGTGNGALDTGSIATSTWYHVYLIKRTDTGVVDVLISTSASSPTMPASYTLKRRIGSMKTDGSNNWTSFTQTGDTFIWAASVNDLNNGTSSTRTNVTLTVPTGVVVMALFRGGVNTSTANGAVIFTSLQENDQAPNASTLADLAAGSSYANGSFARLTDTSARIAYRNNTVLMGSYIYTYGWQDFRGR